jgi:predicted dehydrogenase
MSQISRRSLLAAGAAGFTILPPHVLGRGGAEPPSEKVNVAVIGIGCRGEINVSELASQNLVALCDVDWRPLANYQYPRACEVIKRHPNAKKYDDWRIMLEKEDKNLDAVVVATPDHVHAFAAITAMKMGKHVYVEKPLAHSISEVRAILAAEKKYKVTTQTGNQGHSSEDCRMIVEWVRDGAIGDVKEVHLFLRAGILGISGGSTGVPPYDTIPKLLAEDHPVPKELNWDLWIGPAPMRKFNPVYLPNAWRRWMDFGTGSLGDYNCHYLDPALWALDLGFPESVEANPDAGYDPATNKQTYAAAAEIKWNFPARGNKPPVSVYWHYGANSGNIPLPMGFKPDVDKLPSAGGGVLYGTRGSIVYGPIYASLPRTASTGEYKPITWGTPQKVRLYPDELDKSYKRPAPTLPRPFSHWVDWLDALKARKSAGCNFTYGGLLTQIGHMGNIACRQKGKVLYYDEKAGKFKNNDEANQMFQRPYREGWKLPV